jgi:hypothetical protein
VAGFSEVVHTLMGLSLRADGDESLAVNDCQFGGAALAGDHGTGV